MGSVVVKYRGISIWLAVFIITFSFVDVVDNIPQLQPLSNHPAFLFFSEIDDLLAIGLVLIVAYRWHPLIGQLAIVLYFVIHISHYFLGLMDIISIPIRLGSIGFVSVIGIWLISRLRLIEHELRTSEEMFRTMSDSSPIGIYIVQYGKFRYTNPQFRNYTGYREGELIDTDSLNLVVGEDRDLVRVNAIKMLKGEEAVPYEYRVTTKNGQIKWILETVVSVRYHGKKATLGNFIDITGRKKIEAELKERNIQMTALQQVSQVINQSLEMKIVANLALEESLKVLNLDCGAIRYLDEGTEEIVMLAHKGLTPEMVAEMQNRPRVKVGHGPMGEMVKTGEPLIIQDIPGYPRFEYESTRNSGFQSYLGIPLKINNKVVGTMTGLSRQRRTFTQIDMEMLSSLGNMIGAAISNARFYSDLCRRTTELTALLTIEKGLAGDIPIQRTLGGALIILADAIGADMGTIHLYNNKNQLELVAHHCLSPELLELARKDILHHGILEEAIERHVPVTIDVSKYPGILNGAASLTNNIQIIACAPVLIGERALGVINVARKQSSPFNEEEMELLQSVSSRLAISYERAGLVDDLSLRLERREARSRIAAAISSSLDMETIFRSLNAELPSLVQFDHFAVALFKGNTLEISTISEEYGGLLPRGMVVSADNEMLYRVVQEGKPIIRNDIEKEMVQPLDKKLLAAGIHSTLIIPLNAGGHTFGSLILASREVGKFSETDFQSLKPIADQLAVAVDNSRLFMQIESAAGEWRRTFDTMSDGIAIIGTDFRIKRTNMALARMLGTSPQDLMGRYWYEAVYGTSGPPSDCPIRVCIAEKKTFDREWQEPNLNNRWLHMRGDPILGTNGQVLSIVQTLRDITGEKQRQKNLESLYRLSQSLSTSLNLDTVINLALDEIIPIIGKSNATVGIALLDEGKRELKGMVVRRHTGEIVKGINLPLSDIAENIRRILIEQRQPWVSTDISQAPEYMKKVLHLEKYQSFMAIPLVVGNRTTGILFVTGFDARSYSNEEYAFLETYTRGIALAIENARLFSQTDEALQTQVANLEAIISSMSEGLVAIDIQGKVAYCNQAAGQLLGIKSIEYLGQPVRAFNEFLNSEVIEPTNWRETLAAGIKDAARRPRLRFAIQLYQRRELELTLFSIDSNNQRIGTGAVIRDITSEREIDRMKTEFVSIASHELRTPMTVIYGFAELLLLRSQKLSTEHQQWIEKIYNESKRLTTIVDDFLNVSRIESGRLSVKRELLSVQNIVNQLVGQLNVNYPSHTFPVDLPDSFPLVWADTERLTQVMYNLIDNAAKYSPGGGPITVSAVKLPKDFEAVITVTDTGLGIPPDELPKLFTRFHRVHRPDAANIRGTGLGLYIVKSLVDMMGGRIWVESQVNKGSTFFIALPVGTITRP